MPKTKEQFEEMRNATREKILGAGIALFAHQGLAATSVQDIANAAGISTGLMYRHFKSKEDLFNELVAQAAAGLAETTRAFQQEGSPRQIIQQHIQEALSDLTKDDEFAQFMAVITQVFMQEATFPAVRQLLKENDALFKATARLIERGQTLGQFKPGGPAEMVLYYFATLQGLAIMRFTIRDRFVPPSPEIVLAFLIKDETDERS